MQRSLLSDRALRFGVKPAVFALGLLPGTLLLSDALTPQAAFNPFNAIVRSTGYWSLRFLCLTLAITPLRRLTGWHRVVRFRRMMGLFAFFYGAVHLAAYFVFDRVAALSPMDRPTLLVAAEHALTAAGLEIALRPFFAVGFIGFALLVPLAGTSTSRMIGRLGGRRWRALHRLVYPAAVASVIHTYWPWTTRHPRYAVILAAILLLRVATAWARPPRLAAGSP